eukprot:453559-Heterocapsa_arctica.AAC.1
MAPAHLTPGPSVLVHRQGDQTADLAVLGSLCEESVDGYVVVALFAVNEGSERHESPCRRDLRFHGPNPSSR